MPPVPSDEDFLDRTADRLAALPGVHAVTLGGSRAQGTERPDSDWDLALYYRGSFDPGDLRALGWEGEVCGIGDWGGGVFNGGAWLTVEGRRVDIHYRDLAAAEHELAEAEAGRFRVEPLMFHLVGIPTYLIVAELAVNRVLRGDTPRPRTYPPALRASAPPHWSGVADATLAYARVGHAPRGALAQVAGAVAVAATCAAHAVMAARGEWVTNEKGLLQRAGLGGIDELVTRLTATPDTLVQGVTEAEDMLARAVAEARPA